jgi:glycosyltransferase involved in cell wall biosynthesis
MHIGVDATCWGNNRGYGRHARSLLRALVQLDHESRYTFFMDSLNESEPAPPGVEVRLVRAARPTAQAASSNGRRSGMDMWRMSRALSTTSAQVLLFPSVYSYVPVLSRVKKVVVIHDVIAERFPHLTLPTRRARLFWKAKVRLGRWQADALVTVSDHARRGIAEQFGIPLERVFVVGEANDPVFRPLDNPQPSERLLAAGVGHDRMVVYVGGFSPHKNLETLVTAFAGVASRPEFADVRLVLVGENQREVFHSYFETIKKQVEQLGLADRVAFTGFTVDDELALLLNLSTVLVLPSLLGLPPG